MKRQKKSRRGAEMSQAMQAIKSANPGMPQTQVLSMASKQLSGQRKKGGILPLLPLGIGALTGYLGSKLLGRGLGSGMYLRPYR